MTIQKKEITLGKKIRVQSCIDTDYNFLRFTHMTRNNTDIKLEAVILSEIVFFSQFFFFFNDKGGKIEDEKGARRKYSCVRKNVLIILP